MCVKSPRNVENSVLKRGISSLELVFLEEHGYRVNRLLHIFSLITQISVRVHTI